jgi:hypothetical protein
VLRSSRSTVHSRRVYLHPHIDDGILTKVALGCCRSASVRSLFDAAGGSKAKWSLSIPASELHSPPRSASWCWPLAGICRSCRNVSQQTLNCRLLRHEPGPRRAGRGDPLALRSSPENLACPVSVDSATVLRGAHWARERGDNSATVCFTVTICLAIVRFLSSKLFSSKSTRCLSGCARFASDVRIFSTRLRSSSYAFSASMLLRVSIDAPRAVRSRIIQSFMIGWKDTSIYCARGAARNFHEMISIYHIYLHILFL